MMNENFDEIYQIQYLQDFPDWKSHELIAEYNDETLCSSLSLLSLIKSQIDATSDVLNLLIYSSSTAELQTEINEQKQIILNLQQHLNIFELIISQLQQKYKSSSS